MDKIVRRALENYVASKKTELHPRIKRLIALAKWNLNYGPNMEGQDDDEDTDDGSKVVWPGFEEACREIASGTEHVISDVWVDIQTENVQTSEPEPDSYEDTNPDHDPDDPDSPETITVTNEVDWSDWAMVESQHVKAVLLGELASYVS